MSFLKRNNILYEHQNGFRAKPLLNLINTCAHNLRPKQK